MRVMVVWCPDWSVVAALEEADRSLPLPRRRALGQRRGGLQRSRPRRGRTPGAAPPRRAGAVSRAAAAADQPRPGRPGLRAGPRRGRGPAPGGGRPASRAARRPGPGQLVRQRDRRSGDRLPGAGRDGRVGRAGRHRRRPVHRRAGRPGGGGAGVDGRPSRRVTVRSCADCPSTCCRTTAPAVASSWASCSGSACAPWATSPTCRATRSSTGSAAYGRDGAATGAGRGPDAVRGAHPAARARRGGAVRAAARLRRGDHLQRPHHRRAVRRPARPPPARRHRRAGRGRVRRASCARRARWLHPRHFTARDLVDRVHWQLQSAGSTSGVSGSLRGRKDAGVVRAPIDRVRFVPELVEPAAAHGEALWGSASDDLVERGVARVQGMVGFDAVRRPVLQGGRSPSARQALVPWGERAVGPAPGGPAVAGPGARAGTGPGVRPSPGRRGGRRRRPPGRASTERGVVSGEPRHFRVAGQTGDAGSR